LRALDRVFEWSQARGMRVLLDLHGAPRSALQPYVVEAATLCDGGCNSV
jgi:hypothetical protein